MTPWRFYDYWPREGVNLIRRWEGVQDVKVQTRFWAVLDALAQTPDWRDPPIEHLYRDLTGEQRELGEIVFEAEFPIKNRPKPLRRRFRVFAKLRDEQHDCILFVGCEHWSRHRSYDPPGADRQAMDLYRAFLAGKGFCHGHI